MIDWLPYIATLVPLGVAIVAGINAWKKQRDDRKQGVAASEVAEDDSEAARWKSIIETQTRALLEPMQQQLKEHAEKIRGLEAELEDRKRRYWAAISLIRALYLWIERNFVPDPAKQVPPPPTPIPLIVDDI
jgi:hypothetical protein